VVFDENIAKYTTVVRTKFASFRDKAKCEEEKEELVKNNEKLVKGCNGIVCVDNPAIIDGEEAVLGRKRREESRKKMLDHLESVCQSDVPYKPVNLDNLSKAIGEYMEKKEKLKKEEEKGVFRKIEVRMESILLNK